MTDPRTLKRWLIVIAVLYLVFPRDLLPDFFGRGLGLLDDMLVAALLTWFYRKRVREHASHATEENGRQDRRQSSQRAQAKPSSGSSNPYEILGIDPSAPKEEIRAAYRARMQEYHPDKVAHLGEELQTVAHRKALEIQQAYEELVSK